MDLYSVSLNQFIEIVKRFNFIPNSILEIGSRDGDHAEFLRESFNIEENQVHVIEPNPNCIPDIKSKYPKFNTHEVAFSNTQGEKIFYQLNSGDKNLDGVSSLMYRQAYSNPKYNTQPISVKSTTGYQFLKDTPLSNLILKIDVEGHTYEVLEGFGDKLNEVHFLHIETETFPIWERQKTEIEVNNYLKSKGFFKFYSKNMADDDALGINQQDQIWVNANHHEVTLNNYFDKIFYINLDKDVERNNNVLSEFSKWGVTNFERISGFTFDEVPDQMYWRNFNKYSINRKYILGNLGCRRSHLEPIRLAIERNYSRILILEDDIFFTEDPHKLLAKQNLNNWDLMYFGGLIEPEFRHQVVTGHAYAVNHTLFEEALIMAPASGMEIDNFYAKIIQHMSYNYNPSGRYNVKLIEPFDTIQRNYNFESNIR